MATRIVMVSPDAPPEPNGGLGTYLEGLLGAMASRDVEVHLVATTRDASLPRVSCQGGVSIHRVLAERPWGQASPLRRMAGLAVEYARLNTAAIVLALRLRVRGRVDVVVVHDWVCGPAGLVCGTILRMPMCYHVHSAETFFGEGSRGPVPALGRGLNRLLSRRARLIVTPSYETVAAIPHLAGRDVVAISHGPGKAAALGCPSDDERSAARRSIRQRYQVPEGRRLIVYSGRYAPHKGVYELLEAVPAILAAGVDVALVMAGTGLPDATIDDRLRQRVAALGLSDRVHILGRLLAMDDLRLHLVAADACAFPSTYEPFGFMALEAMALRATTVVGHGFDEDVVGSTAGACVRTATSDPGELAEALARVLEDGDPQMGDRAREYVLEHHSWEAAAALTLQVYSDAFGR